MKKITTFILVLLLCTQCYASITVPFRCHEALLIKYFNEAGVNLDKDDYNSDGFIENKGTSYTLHFYKPLTDYDKFLKLHTRIERKIQEETNGN